MRVDLSAGRGRCTCQTTLQGCRHKHSTPCEFCDSSSPRLLVALFGTYPDYSVLFFRNLIGFPYRLCQLDSLAIGRQLQEAHELLRPFNDN